MVLGRISEKRRITKVKKTENQIRLFAPKTDAAAAPATAAPIVLAMVFKVRIAVIGSSIFSFNFLRIAEVIGRVLANSSIRLMGRE
jgi:hypothetical protein